MTNHADSEDILTDQEINGKKTEFKYLRQTIHPKDTTQEEIYARMRAAWDCFENKPKKQKNKKQNKQKQNNQQQTNKQTNKQTKNNNNKNKEILQINNSSFHSRNKPWTNASCQQCQTWSLNIELITNPRIALRGMEISTLSN